jgi:hypothetical protein
MEFVLLQTAENTQGVEETVGEVIEQKRQNLCNFVLDVITTTLSEDVRQQRCGALTMEEWVEELRAVDLALLLIQVCQVKVPTTEEVYDLPESAVLDTFDTAVNSLKLGALTPLAMHATTEQLRKVLLYFAFFRFVAEDINERAIDESAAE